MGNSKKIRKAMKLACSGVPVVEAAETVGVSLLALQTRMEQEEQSAHKAQADLLSVRRRQFSSEDQVHLDELVASGVAEEIAMATLCSWPELMTVEDANTRFAIRSKMEGSPPSGHVLVIRPEDPSNNPDCCWMCDSHFNLLCEKFSGGYDILTIIINGDLKVHEASISDRLMCLVVTGNLSATELCVFETMVVVYGDLDIRTLTDHDNLLTAHGRQVVDREVEYT